MPLLLKDALVDLLEPVLLLLLLEMMGGSMTIDAEMLSVVSHLFTRAYSISTDNASSLFELSHLLLKLFLYHGSPSFSPVSWLWAAANILPKSITILPISAAFLLRAAMLTIWQSGQQSRNAGALRGKC